MTIVRQCCVCRLPAMGVGEVPTSGYHRQCFLSYHKDEEHVLDMLPELDAMGQWVPMEDEEITELKVAALK